MSIPIRMRSVMCRVTDDIDQPDDYITVFSLRNWAKLRGDVLTTEQVCVTRISSCATVLTACHVGLHSCQGKTYDE